MIRTRPRSTVAVVLPLAMVLTAGCAHLRPAPPAPTLEERIEGVLAAPPLDGVHWGLLVVDAEDGRILYERNAARRFVPASNMKVPVTAAALGLLGPDYRWETGFYAPIIRRDGNDLYLPARGDPTLGPPFHESADEAMAALADSLGAAGFREIGGDLVVDVSAWDSTTVPTSWMVGNLAPRFGATGGAFTVGAGELEIELEGGGAPGEEARLSWRPLGPETFVENRVTTAEADAPISVRTSFLPESRRWVVEGSVPVGERLEIVRAVRDPVRHSVEVLRRALEEKGIPVRGEVRIVWDRGEPLGEGCLSGCLRRCPTLARVAALASPPLSEVVRAILEPSQNWMTEQLVRTLGAERGGEGSWSEGLEAVTDYLKEDVGIDSLDVHLRDGSGLSAYNLLTPRALVAVLDHARRQPWGDSFREAQAEPGREDTTLEDRLPGLEGRVFAKTGTISHVNALSGYLVADDGRELVFSILTNASNLPAAEVRDAIDRLVEELAGGGGGATSTGGGPRP